MQIFVNGEHRDIERGRSLLNLLADLQLDARRVAVAVNASVVPRGELASVCPAENDRIEIIEAVGGG